MLVLTSASKLNFLEIGQVSTSFTKSIIELLKTLSEQKKPSTDVDKAAVLYLKEMGFPEPAARRALL